MAAVSRAAVSRTLREPLLTVADGTVAASAGAATALSPPARAIAAAGAASRRSPRRRGAGTLLACIDGRTQRLACDGDSRGGCTVVVWMMTVAHVVSPVGGGVSIENAGLLPAHDGRGLDGLMAAAESNLLLRRPRTCGGRSKDAARWCDSPDDAARWCATESGYPASAARPSTPAFCSISKKGHPERRAVRAGVADSPERRSRTGTAVGMPGPRASLARSWRSTGSRHGRAAWRSSTSCRTTCHRRRPGEVTVEVRAAGVKPADASHVAEGRRGPFPRGVDMRSPGCSRRSVPKPKWPRAAAPSVMRYSPSGCTAGGPAI